MENTKDQETETIEAEAGSTAWMIKQVKRHTNQGIDRFWTMDSFEGDINEPVSLHKYFAFGNNSVNFVDQNGNDMTEGPTGKAISDFLKGIFNFGVIFNVLTDYVVKDPNQGFYKNFELNMIGNKANFYVVQFVKGEESVNSDTNLAVVPMHGNKNSHMAYPYYIVDSQDLKIEYDDLLSKSNNSVVLFDRPGFPAASILKGNYYYINLDFVDVVFDRTKIQSISINDTWPSHRDAVLDEYEWSFNDYYNYPK